MDGTGRVGVRVRYAIIGDIHANLEALEAVIDDISRQGVDQVVCLGDIVGYYPNPNECAAICRREGYLCLRGNHDDAVLGRCDIDDFNPMARQAIEWTAAVLQEEHLRWLNRLPETLLLDDFIAVHGSPCHPYDYIFSYASAQAGFRCLQRIHPEYHLCFFGHTHVKTAFHTQGDMISQLQTDEEILLHKEGSYLINPGSVGQARDGIPGASYLVYDSAMRKAVYHHVNYDLAATQRKVIAAGLPLMLAERLAIGF